MSDFQSLETTKKGNIAEAYIYGWLLTGQTVHMDYVYSNYSIKAHPFDFICYSGQTKFLGDVKCKYPRYDGTMSIHEKDLEKYLEWSLKENCKFVLFYVNYKNGDINIISPEFIKRTGIKTWDQQENKWLVYFKGWKKIDSMPENICAKFK